MSLRNYRAVCASCDFTSIAAADPTKIPRWLEGTARPEGVYRADNGLLCLKCEECGEPKHAVPADVPR